MESWIHHTADQRIENLSCKNNSIYKALSQASSNRAHGLPALARVPVHPANKLNFSEFGRRAFKMSKVSSHFLVWSSLSLSEYIHSRRARRKTRSFFLPILVPLIVLPAEFCTYSKN